MKIELTEVMVAAVQKLVANQKKNERTADELAFDYFAGTLLGRAKAMAKTANEQNGKNYDMAVAMGFKPTETKGECISRLASEWSAIIAELESEVSSEAAE